jgi:pimeloyl-ACP methyl ester carboxylesterase
MSAEISCTPRSPIEPFELVVPDAAVRKLWLQLERARDRAEVWDASLRYGVPLDQLSRLVDYWCDDFDFRGGEARLNELALLAHAGTCFFQLRAGPGALPVLLLHGSFGSMAELRGVATALSARGFDVVVPELTGSDVERATRACADLMAALGYQRYALHGTERGAAIAQRLAQLVSHRVAGLHLGAPWALPGPDPLELARLSGAEKSQLALLVHLQQSLPHELSCTPIEHLAQALEQLADAFEASAAPSFVDDLLTSLSLRWALHGPDDASATGPRLASTEATGVPAAVVTFPLATPSLRRCLERQHRVVSWTDCGRGGSLPALEQPEALVGWLDQFFTRSS